MIFTEKNLTKVLKKMNNERGLEVILENTDGLKPTDTYNSYISFNFFTEKLSNETATRQPILLKNREHFSFANKVASEISETIIIKEEATTQEEDWGAYPATVAKGFRKVSAVSNFIPIGWEYKIKNQHLQINGRESFDDFKERAIIILTIQVLEALSFIGELNAS